MNQDKFGKEIFLVLLVGLIAIIVLFSTVKEFNTPKETLAGKAISGLNNAQSASNSRQGKSILGVTDMLIYPNHLPYLKELGVKWVAIYVPPTCIVDSACLRWVDYDLGEADRLGITLAASIAQRNEDGTRLWVPEEEAFKSYVRSIAERYDGDADLGGTPCPEGVDCTNQNSIAQWASHHIFNNYYFYAEADDTSKSDISCDELREEIYKPAYQIIKNINSNAVVGGPGVTRDDEPNFNYLRCFLNNGGWDNVDFISQQLYPDEDHCCCSKSGSDKVSTDKYSLTINYLEQLHKFLTQFAKNNGKQMKPVWITETGSISNHHFCLDEDTQNTYYGGIIGYIYSQDWISRVFFYNLYDTDPDDQSPKAQASPQNAKGYGLVNIQTGHKKEAFATLKSWLTHNLCNQQSDCKARYTCMKHRCFHNCNGDGICDEDEASIPHNLCRDCPLTKANSTNGTISCGNNAVESGEQCELSNTKNNAYCTQPTYKCVQNRTVVRDAYGNCNSRCECIVDPYGPEQCIKNSCNAQCGGNDDCNDNNASTNDTCNPKTCSCQYISLKVIPKSICGDHTCDAVESTGEIGANYCNQDCCGDGICTWQETKYIKDKLNSYYCPKDCG